MTHQNPIFPTLFLDLQPPKGQENKCPRSLSHVACGTFTVYTFAYDGTVLHVTTVLVESYLELLAQGLNATEKATT